ncbi:SDR family oxidoreductase [Amycolatopsis acidicola]|uniref:SDR family oxidoreductase n=1 Tax=Amycolatopsis acidicola TaxID=2596893 RepID=A0A5N0UNI9_9PSEU|nr:SDR family oxidoreductase [Amycolatopsis acidicola]KAA9149891.1 SDR family oxidoreductase [Amycolatopsis acidicola]
MSAEVLVVVGSGGMGQAAARRQGPGRTVLLADFDEKTLGTAAESLREAGHDVRTRPVDVASAESVPALAARAAELGRVTQVVHTAGLSPAQASAEAILKVDLLGVGLVLAEFAEVIAPGGAGVVISSMAGHMAPPLPAEQEQALLATAPAELLTLPFANPANVTEPGAAYSIAKLANRVQVQAASVAWGRRGARVNSISPGVISTAMGQQELASPSGAFMRTMIEKSGTGRVGTADDIAAAAAFLLGPESSFVTGTDLLVDGGVVAALRSGALQR